MMRKFFLLLIILGMASVASPVFALTVSPARIEISGDPGSVVQGEIELFNEQDNTKTFFTSSENFEPSGDSGAPRFIGAKSGLATWIGVQEQVVLDSGKRTVVPYSISIPANAEPGGHFAAIFFGSQPPDNQGGAQVSVGGKIGVLILLRVSGEIEEGGGLIDFGTKDGKRFFSSLPIYFTYRLSNSGGDRVVPRGELKFKNTLQLTSAKLLANKNEGSVLPKSTRKFEVVWGKEIEVKNLNESETKSPGFFEMAGRQLKEFHLGWYTANLDISWGETNQTAHEKYSFFVIPWQLLIIALIILTIIFFIGRFGLKKYNRWIIAQAAQRMPK